MFVLYQNTKRTMSENKQKKKVKYNQDALEILTQRFGYSIDYIRKSLRGDRVGILPDRVKKEYSIIVSELEKKKFEIAKN